MIQNIEKLLTLVGSSLEPEDGVVALHGGRRFGEVGAGGCSSPAAAAPVTWCSAQSPARTAAASLPCATHISPLLASLLFWFSSVGVKWSCWWSAAAQMDNGSSLDYLDVLLCWLIFYSAWCALGKEGRSLVWKSILRWCYCLELKWNWY